MIRNKKRTGLIGIPFIVLALLLSRHALAAPNDDTLLYVPQAYAKASSLIQIPEGPNPGGDAVTLKLLIVHTPRFVAALTSEDPDLITFMEMSVAAVNQFMANSGLATRIELAGIIEWDRPAGYGLQSDLEALPDFVENQTNLRNSTAADLVQLWELPEPGVDREDLCGWGQIVGSGRIVSRDGYGYSGVLRGIAGGRYATCYAATAPDIFAKLVAHEIGHNLGSNHDWEDSNGDGVFEFSRGSYCGNTQLGERPGTLMSQSRIRLPYFSNPAIRNDGEACGIWEGQPYPSNNRETITRTASPLSRLREDGVAEGSVSLSVPSSVAEFSPWLPVTLTRSSSRNAAAVELLTYTYGATRDLDFVMPYRVRVEFHPGQRQVIVPVTLLGDERREGQEKLHFWIQAGENVMIAAQRSKLVSLRDNAWPAVNEVLPELDEFLASGASVNVTEPVTANVSPEGDSGAGSPDFWLLLAGLLLLGARAAPTRVSRL